MNLSFNKILGESEVAWGYISVDYRQREILGNNFTLTFFGNLFQLRVNKVGRIVSKKLLRALAATEGMKLTFRKEKEGRFTLEVG